jgi:hypothetical protein
LVRIEGNMTAGIVGSPTTWPSKQDLKKEVGDALVNLIVTTFGVLLGLLLTGLISDRSDDALYQAIANSIHAEAEANKAALEGSFNVYVPTRGLVLNEFRVDVALNSLANPIYLRRAKPAQIEALNKYVRNLSLANNYALTARQLVTNNPAVARLWDENLYKYWDLNLKDCTASIGEVLVVQ